MIVTKVLVLVILIVILCIVSFLKKDTETFEDKKPFSESNRDPKVFREINLLNKLKHEKNIGNEKVKNKQKAVEKIQNISTEIDTKMEQLMHIQELLKILPTCREIDLVPNDVNGIRVPEYKDDVLKAKCAANDTKKVNCTNACNGDPECVLKCEANYKRDCINKGDGHCIYDKNLDGEVTLETWNEEVNGYKCQLRTLNKQCDKIKKLNGAGDKFEYGPYLVPNAFNSF